MMKYFFFTSIILILSSCYKGENADLIIHNAVIYSMDENATVYQAMAIKDGKIIELGAERQILNKYKAKEEIDAKGRDVYPGFTDAHGHMLSYAKQKLSLDLVGTTSMQQLIVKTEIYQQKNNRSTIIGSGWDQSLWGSDSLPNNNALNTAFPTTPVCLVRIDGHALLANDAMLKKAGIDATTKVEGGIILVKEGKPTGVLVDNAMNLVYQQLPAFSQEEMIGALLEVEQELFMYGITNVHEAGIENDDINLFKLLIDKHNFNANIYAMLMPSKANIAFAAKNGPYEYKNLSIRSFKVMGDGALGSRGAFLKQEYSDEHNHFGVLTTSPDAMNEIARMCLDVGYQMNTHAIGDATNKMLLDIYSIANKENPDHRWRIEHAQVIDPEDFGLFAEYGVIPSVQPTHAVSDQRWAEARLGKERMKGAYAYKTLLKNYGMLALGTDFPVEKIDPFMTIFSATQRKNSDNYPHDGFYPQEAISLEDCLKGMTIWAAIAAFQEQHLGHLSPEMDATFAIFEKPIKNNTVYEPNFAMYTYVKGNQVYAAE